MKNPIGITKGLKRGAIVALAAVGTMVGAASASAQSSAYCDRYARDYASDYTGGGADVLRGGILGAGAGAIIGGLVDGGRGAGRGAIIGGGVGTLGGAAHHTRQWRAAYNHAYADCMNDGRASYRGRPPEGTRDWIEYCSSKYRSFDPSTGYYRTYSGKYRRCR